MTKKALELKQFQMELRDRIAEHQNRIKRESAQKRALLRRANK